jgi:4-hydroxy-4-methyl-2-oxoglutarate aldolase
MSTKNEIDTDSTLALYDEFAMLGTATVYEAAGRVGLVDLPLRRFGSRRAAAGPVRTVACAPGDNLTLHIALRYAHQGDVLVVATPHDEPVALFGELLGTQAVAKSCAGLVISAAVRDADKLDQLPLVVLARHVRVRGATRRTFGAIDVPLILGGVSVRPGDIAVLDADGAVVVPQDRIHATLGAARDRADRESRLREKFAKGSLSYDEYGLADLDPLASPSDDPHRPPEITGGDGPEPYAKTGDSSSPSESDA